VIPPTALPALDMQQYLLVRQHCTPPTQPIEKQGMYLLLTHGRLSADAEMDDWGFDGPVIGPLSWCHITYGALATIGFADGTETDFLEPDVLSIQDGLLYFDGAWYGDWEFQVLEGD
jgi:hypothetical protein